MRTTALIAAAAFAALTGCGAGASTAAPVVTVTATQPAPKETTKPAAKKDKEPAAERKALPNVVGLNLQAGQDTMQAAGFYLLNDKDATGQGRFQVSDRNWVVTKQTPAAGRKVAVDTLVTLYAKKIGE
jgi:PASTA domain-containing protein